MIDKTHRLLAASEAHASRMYPAMHHTWRLTQIHGAGLTEKERRYANQIHEDMLAVTRKLEKLCNRLGMPETHLEPHYKERIRNAPRTKRRKSK